MRKYAIYGLGAALVDTEISVTDEQLKALNIEKGLMTLVDEKRQSDIVAYLSSFNSDFKRASGGSAANSIIAASYFGSDCLFTGKVADDQDGHFYLEDLENAGVSSINKQQLSAGITGKCLVLITPDAERSMNTFLGASETLSPALLNLEAVGDAEYIYIEGYLVTSPTGKASAETLRDHAIKNQTKIAVSLSDPGIVQFFKEGLAEMFGSKIDLIFCNKDEALAWAGTEDLAEAEILLKKQTQQYAITLGSKGAIIWDGSQRYTVSAPSVEAIDTNGAGDMFAGAFLHALTAGKNAKECGSFACNAAANVVAQFGPRLQKEQYLTLKETL